MCCSNLQGPICRCTANTSVKRWTKTSKLELPELAGLAAAASRYVTLAGKEQLDASTTNTRMLTPLRRQAREGLARAIGALSKDGAKSPRERDFHNLLSTFGDEMIAGVVSRFTDAPKSAQCGGRNAIAAKSPLRDTFDRLQKKRRTLLGANPR